MDPLRELSTEDWHSICPGVEDINPIPMTGGYSGAGLYKVIIDNKAYVVRQSSGRLSKTMMEQELAINSLAIDQDIAPHQHYKDLDKGITVTDFIENQLSSDQDPRPFRANTAWQKQVAGLARKLHQIDCSQYDFADYNAMSNFKKNYHAVPSHFLTETQIKRLDKIEQTPWPEGEHVLAHGDLSVGNLIFDGKRFWLVDWDKAGLNHPFWDMAYFANFCIMNDDEGIRLLGLYLERTPTSQEMIDFEVIRNLFWGLYGIAMINFGYQLSLEQGIEMPKVCESSLTLEEMYLAFGRDNVVDLYNFGTRLLEKVND